MTAEAIQETILKHAAALRSVRYGAQPAFFCLHGSTSNRYAVSCTPIDVLGVGKKSGIRLWPNKSPLTPP